MAVLLGATSKYEWYSNNPNETKDRIQIHQFLDLKKNAQSRSDLKKDGQHAFYILYKAQRELTRESDGKKYIKSYSIPSPIFEGIYDGPKYKKEITKWIKTITTGNPKAQYLRDRTEVYKLADFKRGYKAKF